VQTELACQELENPADETPTLLTKTPGPLADWDEYASRPVIVVWVVVLGSRDLIIDRIGDGTVGSARLVLVDHRGALAVVPHAGHQVTQPGTAASREMVAGVAQVVEVQALSANSPCRCRNAVSPTPACWHSRRHAPWWPRLQELAGRSSRAGHPVAVQGSPSRARPRARRDFRSE
jgi:hypothetical protein